MTDDEEKTLSLRVAKAIPSDVGHGRARVPFDNDLGLSLAMSSKLQVSVIPTIVWRCRPEDANLGVIRIDGIIRKNAGVSLGDRSPSRRSAQGVRTTRSQSSHGQATEGQIWLWNRRFPQGLNKRPVVAGDRIFIPGMTLCKALHAVTSTKPRVSYVYSLILRLSSKKKWSRMMNPVKSLPSCTKTSVDWVNSTEGS